MNTEKIVAEIEEAVKRLSTDNRALYLQETMYRKRRYLTWLLAEVRETCGTLERLQMRLEENAAQ